MRQHERRQNEEFRRALHERWIEEATSAREPLAIDSEHLWHKIDEGLRRAELTSTSWSALRMCRWSVAVAVAAGIVAALLVGLPLRGPKSLQKQGDTGRVAQQRDGIAPGPSQRWRAADGQVRQSLMHPEFLRCDDTKQSCELEVNLSSAF